jgi:phosphonopyruvate decarboxylase
MLNCQELFEVFNENNLTFFSGVPDSTFKDWMKFLVDKNDKGLTNIPAVNECEAAAIVAGRYLSTREVGVIYMQNSGLGKTINPITSLLSKEVYSIPAILMIGWRGEPDKKDEPQHKMMGRIMEEQLKTLEIPYEVLPSDINKAKEVVKRIYIKTIETAHPTALIVKKGTLEEYVSQTKQNVESLQVMSSYENISELEDEISLTREDAIKSVVEYLGMKDIIISTTGKASRELYELREERNEGHEKDFLTVGSMGCSSAIALGISTYYKNLIYIFDGDGAALMQMGTFATIGSQHPKNMRHIIFDNKKYGSTGNQPTVSGSVDFGMVALASNYAFAKTVNGYEGIIKALNEMKTKDGPCLLRILVKSGVRKDLGRPTITPIQNKYVFMNFLQQHNN